MEYFVYYLIIINIVSFIMYGVDKLAALRKGNRISERSLFFLSFIGGSIGSMLGMFLFRHKIRKVKFYMWNILMVFVWSYLIYKWI